ncbi:glycosyltransferase family 2 protein [soil metagenome]
MPLDSVPRAVRALRISCVVPCFNEGRSIELLVPALRRVLEKLADEWEVIFVDDGSSDDTAEVLKSLSKQTGFRAVLLSRNFGKEAALTAGMQAARGDVVVLMDGDLQHPPELIETMVRHWRDNADVVYAVHASRHDESLLKRIGARLTYAMLNMSSRVRVPEGGGDFRLLDRSAVDAILRLPERNRFMKGLYAWVGFKAVGIEYSPPPRAFGKSSFNLLSLLGLAVDGITAFTTWPLRMVSVVGILLAIPSFIYGGFLVGEHVLYGNPVSGWTTLVVCLLLFFGVQMISIGILGEYVARIFEEVKGRPLFVVRAELGSGL